MGLRYLKFSLLIKIKESLRVGVYLEVTSSQAFYTFCNSFYLTLFLLVISVCGIIKIAKLNNSLTDNMGIYW